MLNFYVHTPLANIPKMFLPKSYFYILYTFILCKENDQNFNNTFFKMYAIEGNSTLKSYSCSEVDSALVFLLVANIWWLLVESDAKTFQLVFNELLVSERLQNVQDNQDEVASASNCWKETRSGKVNVTGNTAHLKTLQIR